jgi:hypothetical protein
VTQWIANGTAICNSNNSQIYPQICGDGAGGAIVTWQDMRSGSDYDIYAQRINSMGAVQWIANGVPVCTASNIQEYPQICSDGARGAIITWQDMRSGSDYDIYTQLTNATDPCAFSIYVPVSWTQFRILS